MATFDRLSLEHLGVFLDLANVAPGNLLMVEVEGISQIGIRAHSGGGNAVFGFIPLEGPNLGIFISDGLLGTIPALQASKFAQIVVAGVAPSNISASAARVGDILLLQGNSELCLAVGRQPGQVDPSGYLMLQGDLAGQIINGYNPRVRLGVIAVDPIEKQER